jgi:hypothetical protein
MVLRIRIAIFLDGGLRNGRLFHYFLNRGRRDADSRYFTLWLLFDFFFLDLMQLEGIFDLPLGLFFLDDHLKLGILKSSLIFTSILLQERIL